MDAEAAEVAEADAAEPEPAESKLDDEAKDKAAKAKAAKPKKPTKRVYPDDELEGARGRRRLGGTLAVRRQSRVTLPDRHHSPSRPPPSASPS